ADRFGRPTRGSGSAASSASRDASEAGSSSSSKSVRLATTDWALQQAAAGGGGPRASPHDVEDCENLLEFYYVQAEALLGRLDALTERIDDTEDLVNIDLDNRRDGRDLLACVFVCLFVCLCVCFSVCL
ncbi:hypothetical protein Vafri_16338, partial [Volvox africanus]